MFYDMNPDGKITKRFSLSLTVLQIKLEYRIFIEYSVQLFTLKMMLKYSLCTIHGR
jgi:hypothetical protein